MKVSDILDDSEKTRFSLEVYPPKVVSGEKTPIQFQLSKIFETVERLLKYNPAFVSVTYNPEGKTKETSIPLAAIIRQRFKIETVAHLTCIATTREDLSKTLEVIDFLRKTNFENVVIRQTVFSSRTGRIDLVEDGYGKGSFVIIKAIKQTNLKEC